MISICIPIYNVDCRALLFELSAQAERLEVPYELLAIDDGSEESFRSLHRSLDLPHLRYLELEENVGRSKIRNLLIRESHYPYLLFMDCDVSVPSGNYLSDYLVCCRPGYICYGGRVYDKQPPEHPYLLHWKYGTDRESLPAEIRREKPNYGFCTNNFLADKNLLLQTGFNETIRGYGHEDTLIGWELAEKGILIHHINNPLIHIGLEDVSVYLGKVKNSLTNLRQIAFLLEERGADPSLLSGLISFRRRLEKLGLNFLAILFYRLFKSCMLRHLKGKHPSLIVFDLYRLSYYCSLS